MLRERLHQSLRDDAGAAYAPWPHYEAVDEERAVAFVGTDFTERLRPTVVDRVLADLDGLSRSEGLAELLEKIRAGVLQSLRDPLSAPGLAARAAYEHLQGRPVTLTLAENLAGVESVTVEGLAGAFAEFRTGLLLGVEGAAGWTERIRMGQMPIQPIGVGRSCRSTSWPVVTDRLVVGPQLLQIGPRQGAATVAFDRVAAVLATPDGARQIIDADGWTLRVEPALWRHGAEMVAELDRRIPADRVIPVPRQGDPPRPASRGERLRAGWRLATSQRSGILAILVIVALVALLLVGVFAKRPVIALFALIALIRIVRSVLNRQ